MAISYSGEGYRLAPQVANLAPLARLQAIDVTRGGGLQYAPLSPIQVPSAQPELVAEGISKGMQSIASGTLGGIKAKWEADEAVRLAEAKGAAEAAKEKAKIEAMKEDPLYKARKELIEQQTEATKALKETREGLKNRLPAGTSTPVFDEVESSSSPDITMVEPDLPKLDDYEEPNSEISAATTYPSSVEMERRIESQAPSLQYLSPESVTASTDASGPIVSPVSFSIQDIKAAPLVSEQQAKEAEQATAASRKALEAIKPPAEAPRKSKFTPQPVKDFRTQQEANEYASTDFAGYEVGTPQEMRDPKGGTFYRVISKKYSAAEMQKQKADKEEAERKAKIAAEAPAWSDKQVSVYDKLYSNVQQNPLIKNAIDAKSSQQLVETSLNEDTGFGDIAAINAFQRMVDPGVAVREGDINLMQQAIPRLQRIGLTIEGWFVGDRLTKKGRSEMLNIANNLASSRISSGSQAIEDLRSSARNAGIDPDLIVRPIELEKKTEPATESKFKVGQKIKNKSTGEELQWDGAKWVPVK